MISQAYAEGSMDHMLSVKAVARAVRAHLLVDSGMVALYPQHVQRSTGL